MTSKQFRKFFKKEIDFAIKYLKLDIGKQSQIKTRNLGTVTQGYFNQINNVVYVSSGESLVNTLFHELVHYKQNQKGILKVERGKVYFKGKLQFSDGKSYDEYFNSKHERQARVISARMIRIFNKYN